VVAPRSLLATRLETGLQMAGLIRANYYTSCQGDEAARNKVRDALRAIGFDSTVAYRPSEGRGRPSKGVDITLTTDMLRQPT
jgi:NYN domain